MAPHIEADLNENPNTMENCTFNGPGAKRSLSPGTEPEIPWSEATRAGTCSLPPTGKAARREANPDRRQRNPWSEATRAGTCSLPPTGKAARREANPDSTCTALARSDQCGA